MKVGSQGKSNKNLIGKLQDILHHKKMLKSKTRLNIEVVAALFFCLWPQCYAPSFSELNQPEASKVLHPPHFCKQNFAILWIM